MEKYEIAVIYHMYDKGLIGERNYTGIQNIVNRIKWSKIASKYKVKKRFVSVAQKLVKYKLLSDDGKSMQVLYVTKFGAGYIIEYMKRNHNENFSL